MLESPTTLEGRSSIFVPGGKHFEGYSKISPEVGIYYTERFVILFRGQV